MHRSHFRKLFRGHLNRIIHIDKSRLNLALLRHIPLNAKSIQFEKTQKNNGHHAESRPLRHSLLPEHFKALLKQHFRDKKAEKAKNYNADNNPQIHIRPLVFFKQLRHPDRKHKTTTERRTPAEYRLHHAKT